VYSNLNTSSLVSVDQQLIALANVFEEIRGYLTTYRPAFVPDKVYEAVSEMSEELPNLRKQVATLEGEWRNLRALAQIGQVVNSSLDLDMVLQIVMDTIIRLTGAERGFLMLRKEDSEELEVRVARNWGQESLVDQSEYEISRTIINRVVTDGQPVLTTNAQDDPRFESQKSVVAYNLRSILCVPLMVKRDLTGVLYADNRVRSGLFTKRHLELISAFANQAAVAIENARLFASVRKTLDEVTELKNLMDNVFASIPSGVLTAGADQRILLCNQAAAEILGQTKEQLMGLYLNEALPALSAHVAHALEGQTVMGLEINPTLIGRGDIDLRLSLSPLIDSGKTAQGVAIVMEDLTEKRHLEGQRRIFERMVSPAVIDQLNPDSLQPGGQRREITTLFADLRGFTSFSEQVEPEELVMVLNRYLGIAADAVLNAGGTIDKFLGDAIMAWFNAPLPQLDHTLNAVRSALAMQAAVGELTKNHPGLVKLSFGVGIHMGAAVLGLVGTEKRLEYTAIGDSVNTARRIQEAAGAGQILISRAAYERVQGRVIVGDVLPIRAYGKRDPVIVVEVKGLRSDL
jgi:adenylate cyclase